jgi:hypothetical protein
MKREIRNFDDWPWQLYSNTFEGVTLKHVVDHILCFSPVKHEKECPTPTYEPYWVKF